MHVLGEGVTVHVLGVTVRVFLARGLLCVCSWRGGYCACSGGYCACVFSEGVTVLVRGLLCHAGTCMGPTGVVVRVWVLQGWWYVHGSYRSGGT